MSVYFILEHNQNEENTVKKESNRIADDIQFIVLSNGTEKEEEQATPD